MNLLVTAGNTKVLLDRVRCITNIFTGRTGAGIALHAHERGHTVTLLTSHPEVVADIQGKSGPPHEHWTLVRYDTFDDLQRLMAEQLASQPPDVVIHSAAVSDYLAAGIYAPVPGTRFDADTVSWKSADGPPALVDRAAGKVKSDEAELWLRLVRAPKLIDRIRTDWGFRGQLVKFKLEVGQTDAELLETAERSRQESAADLMVANTLETSTLYAFVGPIRGQYQRVTRPELPAKLLDAIEQIRRGEGHG